MGTTTSSTALAGPCCTRGTPAGGVLGAGHPGEVLTIPHHTIALGAGQSQRGLVDRRRPLPARGGDLLRARATELTADDHPWRPTWWTSPSPARPAPTAPRDGWMTGQRMGTIASSDNHCARPGREGFGVLAVYAPALTREAVFDAIHRRRTYGTTGSRIVLDFTLNGTPMGVRRAWRGGSAGAPARARPGHGPPAVRGAAGRPGRAGVARRAPSSGMGAPRALEWTGATRRLRRGACTTCGCASATWCTGGWRWPGRRRCGWTWSALRGATALRPLLADASAAGRASARSARGAGGGRFPGRSGPASALPSRRTGHARRRPAPRASREGRTGRGAERGGGARPREPAHRLQVLAQGDEHRLHAAVPAQPAVLAVDMAMIQKRAIRCATRSRRSRSVLGRLLAGGGWASAGTGGGSPGGPEGAVPGTRVRSRCAVVESDVGVGALRGRSRARRGRPSERRAPDRFDQGEPPRGAPRAAPGAGAEGAGGGGRDDRRGRGR